MAQLTPANPDYRTRLFENVEQPGFTSWLGTAIMELEPGMAELSIENRPELSQHHGYFHGGVIGALADNACGIAAGTLVPEDRYPITSEYKINILRPAMGATLIARASVVKPGATIIVCRADVFHLDEGEETLTATMLATLVTVPA